LRVTHTTVAAATALLFASSFAHGQQLYVDDKLVLNVYAEVDQGGGRVATIETGDVVEEIERVEKFVRVRLSDGREGWVGSSYLTSQPPAIVRLKELQAGQPASASAPAGDSAQTKKLSEDVARLQKQNASLSAELSELKKKPAVASSLAAPAVNPTAASAPVGEPERVAPAPVVVQRSYWWAWLLAVLAAAGGGYYVGYQTLGRRVRERFGGVKVY
jgi:hypothetical protein